MDTTTYTAKQMTAAIDAIMVQTDALREMTAERDALRAALRDMQADRDQWCLQANWALRAQIEAEAALREMTAERDAYAAEVTA